MITCPDCGGEKGGYAFACGPKHHFEQMYITCSFCDGKGEVTEEQAKQYERGKVLRAARVAKEYSMREMATLAGKKMLEWNDLEHGRASLAEIEAAIIRVSNMPSWNEAKAQEAR